MDVDTKGRRFKKRQKLEKLKKEAKRRRLKAKSKAREKENLKEIAMGARLKKLSGIESEGLHQVGLIMSEEILGVRDKSEAKSAHAEVMDQNGEAVMDGRKKASKARSKEKVDFKKLFRFQSFSERIANVRIDVSHRVQHTTDSPEDRETFFSEALQKWSQLNCTSEFVSFEREVRTKVDTLAQLVYHKDEIISKLKERLLVKHSLAYEPLLDLLVQFARDVQSEFYPYFKEMFPILVGMCDCQDADLIQCVFTSLAYLLKFLWRQMLKDLGNVFRLYSDLLSSSQRPHIRQFAVESFGFLLRKVRDLEGLVVLLFAEVTKDSELAEGVGQLLFEVCKGVPFQFHSCTEKLFPLLLSQLGSPQYSPSAVFQTLTKLVQLMAEHTRAQFSTPVWTPLLAQLSDAHAKWSESEEEGGTHRAEVALSHSLHLVGVMVSWRNGSRIAPRTDLVQPILKILSESRLPGGVLSVAVQLAASLILVSPNVPECHAHLAQLVKGVAKSNGGRSHSEEDISTVLKFFQELADKYSGFEYDILPECLRYCESALQHDDIDSNNLTSVLKFLCELCLHFDPVSTNRGTIVNLAHSSFSLDLGENLRPLHVPAYNTRSHQAAAAAKSNIVKYLERLLESGLAVVRSAVSESEVDSGDNKLELLWAALVCFKYIRPVEKSCLIKFQDLFDALKDVLRPPESEEDDLERLELEPEEKQPIPLPGRAGVESFQQQLQQWQRTSQLLLIYSQCLSSFVWCFSHSMKEERERESGELSLPATHIVQILMRYPTCLPLLCSLCQYSELVGAEELTCKKMVEVLPLLHRNLSSPSSSVRLATLRILKYFDQLSPSSSLCTTTPESREDDLPWVTAVEICLTAEEIPAQLQTYRDKLLWLQRLKYGAHKFQSGTSRENPAEIPLRYLIGMLYVNFSLLWEPVCEIIRSYAVEEYRKPFWEVFGSYLEDASSLAEYFTAPTARDFSDVSSWHQSLSSLFSHQNELMVGLERGCPDHTNFRILIWKCVAGFNTEFSESHSRILVPLLLRFIQNEFSLKENNFMESQDIRKSTSDASTSRTENNSDDKESPEEMDVTTATMVVEGDDDHNQLTEEEASSSSGLLMDADSLEGQSDDIQHREDSVPDFDRGRVRKSGVAKRQQLTSGRNLNKTLTTMLTVFSSFHNPRAFYKESELREFYMKLLTHYDSEVQKLAFFCLLTYKPPYLLPYKENFELLMDDSSFREELPNFSLDSECSVVSVDHREELLPVLIRVLYGRMQKQGGVGGSKSGGNPRRGMVLRFLGGCEGSEMAEFISLLILPFKNLLLPAPGDSTATKVDPSCVIPLKKQQGFLNMFGQMISILGSKLEPQLAVMFPITVRLGSFCAQLLEQRDQIQPHFVNALKILRQLILTRVNECYGKFTEFDISPYQEEVFSALVWPQVTKLPQECIQNPTPLMKLLLTWTQHQQYHSLLSISIPHSITESTSSSEHSPSILYYVYSCLFAPRVSPKVCSCVMEMTTNLLSGYDSEDQKQISEIKDALDSTETQHVETGMGMETERSVSGPDLVLPLIPKLLSYMSTVIESEGKRVRAGNEIRNLHLEFTVISKISHFVKDPVESSHLIQLLLPFPSRPSEKYKKYEEDILLAVVNLSTQVDSFVGFYRPISQLFGQISTRQSRSLLCTIFQELSEKDLDLKATSSIIQKLNSWDKKHVDEPDYNLRLEGFSEAKQLMEENEEAMSSKVYLILPILHNALFFLSLSEDMSIRDAAASFVSDLISHVKPEDDDGFQLLVMTTMVAAVKKGLRSKLDFARQEYISVLSQLVKAFPTHPRFSSMASLSHHEPEADFFENVKHIQLHRRTRAFRKLASLCAEGTLSQPCVMKFILPLANHVVFTPVTNTEQNLIAEVVNVIGSIAAQLSWPNYSFILHHYLRQLPRKLDIQKTLIKVVVAVLDNFHFDLSLAQSTHQEDEGTNSEQQTSFSQKLCEGERTSVAREADGLESEESQEELEMEVDESESGAQEDKEKSVEEDGDLTKQRAVAQKIHKAIVNSILPSLEGVLTKRIDVPGHKLSRLSHENESKSEQLRVPVAMAITKLLLTLPEETLHNRLPSLLLKVCQTLKNRLRDVRDTGRDTLVKMACALGPKYLNYIVKEMKDMLNRGYMLHVLGYSLHSILRGISSPKNIKMPPPSLSSPSSTVPSPSAAVSLRSGDLNACLDLISSILIEDLFGTPAEERESGENVAKIPESKTPQSYNSYEILAQFLSPRLIPDLLTPVREVLETKSTSRVAHTVEEICRRVSLGIQNNEGFTPQALLVFVHSVLNDSIPQLSSKSKSKPHPSSSSSASHDRPEDSRLIPPEPGRSGPKPVSAGNVGASIITEFGLQLLHIGLKRGKFDSSSEEQLRMLDPFVPLLTNSLGSRHVKVLSRSLQCLIWVMRMPLPSLKSHMNEISTHLFGLLRRYARAGAAVGSNRELVNSAFKAMTVILRDFKKQDVSEDELTVLLSFVEEDIYDHQRQSTAFPLLKAILGRKFVSSEVFELMQSVCQLSITSDSEHVRQQCRQCILQFMLDYPLGKKLNRYLDFFVINLSYEHQSGRESVIEQLSSIFTKFPERLLNNHATFFFVPLCCQLVNEESKTVREMIGETLKTLLSRMDTIRSNEVQNILELWFNSDELIQKRLASLVLGLWVEVEGQSFEKRLPLFLPLLHQSACLYDPEAPDGLCTTEEVTEQKTNGDSKGDGTEEGNEDGDGDTGTENGESGMEVEPSEADSQAATVQMLDHLLFSILSTLRKICGVCSVLRGSTQCEVMNQIWEQVQVLLLHPHAWVRLTSSQLYGLLFSKYTPDELVAIATQEDGSGRSRAKGGKSKKKRRSVQKKELLEYIHQETIAKVQDLAHAFCTQLSSHLLFPELANQTVKNLVFVGKVLSRFGLAGVLKSREEEKEEVGEDREGEGEGVRDLQWLVERMLRLARFEAARHPKESIKRTSVLQWTAAISMDLGEEHLPSYLPSLLRPVYRELADSNKTGGDELHSLAQEVVDLMKGVCGKEAFSQAYALVHQTVLSSREKRRQQAALEAVTNPQKSIQRKQRKHMLKRLAKKRQLLFHRPTGTAAAAVAASRRRRLKHRH